MDDLEILYRCGTAQIEDVLAHADVACATALTSSDVSQSMFNAGAPPQPCSAVLCILQHSQLRLQVLVVGNADASAFTVCRMRALAAELAGATDVRVELDNLPRLKRFGLSGRTGNGV